MNISKWYFLKYWQVQTMLVYAQTVTYNTCTQPMHCNYNQFLDTSSLSCTDSLCTQVLTLIWGTRNKIVITACQEKMTVLQEKVDTIPLTLESPSNSWIVVMGYRRWLWRVELAETTKSFLEAEQS